MSTYLTIEMKIVEKMKRQWQTLVFAYRFMQIVKAPDGDMNSIGQLAKASSDAYSLKLLVEFLSRYPQGVHFKSAHA